MRLKKISYLFLHQKERMDFQFNFPFFLNIFILLVFLALFFYFSFNISLYNFDFSLVYSYKDKFFIGFITTILISLFALFLSAVFAFLLCYMQLSRIIIFNIFSKLLIEVLRGTPLLVQILLFYYIVADALGFENRYIVGVVILALFSSVYICEIFRAGILSVSLIQIQSAKALGFKEWQIFIYIIFPQALKSILAPLSGQMANLIKDSSLLSVIAVNELTQNASEINAYTFSTLEAYIPLAFMYLSLTLPISIFSRYLEKKSQK